MIAKGLEVVIDQCASRSTAGAPTLLHLSRHALCVSMGLGRFPSVTSPSSPSGRMEGLVLPAKLGQF
jgi:hypothetical protein